MIAAKTYVDEREKKRKSGINIIAHRLFNSRDSGKLVFDGVRRIGSQTMALLKSASAEHILVLPVDTGTAKRLKNIKRGDVIATSAQGELTLKSKSKGRER